MRFSLPVSDLFVLIGAAMFIPQVLLNKVGPWKIFDRYEKNVRHIQALHCQICLTFWLSMLIVVLRLWIPDTQTIWLPFGMAGWALWAGVSLQAVITRDEEKDNGEQI